MPPIIFVSSTGERSELEAPVGTSVMRAAVTQGLEGILGECGGSLACGTCHVYVEPCHLGRLPPPSAAEEQMLEMTASERSANSRLSCQIMMTGDLGGLVLKLPPKQE
jgi:2Fe-2S ferredoxin